MNYEIVGLVLAALFMILGGLVSLYKTTTSMRKERQEENEITLTLAKEYVDNKFVSLEKELQYHKEIYGSKVVELSEKIEQLREETRRHHNQLVDLLTKMIDKN